MAALVGVSAGASLAVGCEPDCRIEGIVEARVDDQPHVDCGDYVDIDLATYRVAHDCIAAAIASSDSFTVIWTKPWTEDRIAGGYVGLPGEVDVEIQHLYYDAYDNVTLVGKCIGLVDLGDCDNYRLETQLCFECAGETGLDRCPPL